MSPGASWVRSAICLGWLPHSGAKDLSFALSAWSCQLTPSTVRPVGSFRNLPYAGTGWGLRARDSLALAFAVRALGRSREPGFTRWPSESLAAAPTLASSEIVGGLLHFGIGGCGPHNPIGIVAFYQRSRTHEP